MNSVLLAELTILLELQTVWIISLVLVGPVISILALCAFHTDADAHPGHLQRSDAGTKPVHLVGSFRDKRGLAFERAASGRQLSRG